jgi:hypothetical protein
MRIVIQTTVAAVLLLTSTASADRPEPKAIGEWASPVTTTQVVDGKTEGQRFLDSLPAELRAELERDKQVLLKDDHSTGDAFAGYIRAVALFEGPKDRVYELIVEPTKQPLYLPRLTGAEAVDVQQNGELIEFNLRVLMVRIQFYTQHWFYPEYSRVEWFLDHDRNNGIAEQEGYWQLYAVNENLTVGEYGTLVNTGVAVPRRIQEMLARRDIPSALTAFRSYIDSDGTFRRD